MKRLTESMKRFGLVVALAGPIAAPLTAQGGPFPMNGMTQTYGFVAHHEDVVIPQTNPPALIRLVVKGGDGGNASYTRSGGATWHGGRGARLETLFAVGTGPDELEPGGTLRFIVGSQGEDYSRTENANTGGGGGTGVLYMGPNATDFVPLFIAGGGGGAVGNRVGASTKDGLDASFGTSGLDGRESGCEHGLGGHGGQAGTSGVTTTAIGSTCAGVGGHGGGGYFTVASGSGGAAGYPAGGPGGRRGGWGCGGGGGANTANNAAGGGGGYSGGGGGGSDGGGGGGGSFAAANYTRSPVVTSFDAAGVRNGYATLTPIAASAGETIGTAIDVLDPGLSGETILFGNTADNIVTVPTGYVSSCSPSQANTPDEWYRLINDTDCPRLLSFTNRGGAMFELTAGWSLDGSTTPICQHVGGTAQLAQWTLPPRSSTYVSVAASPSVGQTVDYRLAISSSIPNGTMNPQIVTQPSHRQVVVGAQQDPVIFRVVATGAARYQWFRIPGVLPPEAIPGQTGPELRMDVIACEDAYSSYMCRVYGCGMSVDSDHVGLTVGPRGRFDAYGTSCAAEGITHGQTFYEQFGGFDLSRAALRFEPWSGGYVETVCSNCFDPNYGNALGLGDDQLSRGHALGFAFPLAGGGTTSSIDIDSNGWVGLVSGAHAGSQYFESVQRLLDDPARIAGLWQDLNPSAGGEVYFDAFADRALITWVDVPEYGGNEPNTAQIQLYPDGSFVLAYRDQIRVSGCIVGHSVGGGVLDPGATDLSDFPTAPQLRGISAPPTLGETYSLAVEATGPITGGLMQIGLEQADYDLTLFGLPGCSFYQVAAVTFDLPPFQGGRSVLTYRVPTSPAVLWRSLYFQAFVYHPGANAAGILATNGVRVQFGVCR